MKIYTKTGDKGQTSLIGGKRVAKDDVRLEAYGNVDELNSWVGLLVSELSDGNDRTFLLKVQNTLFDLGSTLALDVADGMAEKYGIVFPSSHVSLLEAEIDRLSETLPQLKSFVLPGGSRQAALCHVCRTVCRRTERSIYAVKTVLEVSDEVLAYVNRLSDYFFVLARSMNGKEGSEIFYVKS